MSRVRQQKLTPQDGELATAPEGDAKPFEVFVQLRRGRPHFHAGTIDAVDGETALRLAREHYGQDQDCVHIWVVSRDDLLETAYEDVITRPTGRDYRHASGYSVRPKWEKIRNKRDLEEYEKGDLKEAF